MTIVNITRRRMLAGTGAGVLATLTALTTVKAGLADDGQRGQGLEGTWATLVTQTQPIAVPPFHALVTFAAGGSVVEVNQRNQPAGVGVWSKISEREYRYAFTRFRFDTSGGFIGWVTADEAVNLDDRRDTFEAAVSLQTFDRQGQPIGSAIGISRGTRIKP